MLKVIYFGSNQTYAYQRRLCSYELNCIYDTFLLLLFYTSVINLCSFILQLGGTSRSILSMS